MSHKYLVRLLVAFLLADGGLIIVIVAAMLYKEYGIAVISAVFAALTWVLIVKDIRRVKANNN